MSLQFEDQVALVTGATRGKGRATAIAFCLQEAKVVLAGRREKEGQDVVALVKKAGGETVSVARKHAVP
jgi:NAD(P)-dependent dehydrogenase (short-subunit alcohol dehydrogenase family)